MTHFIEMVVLLRWSGAKPTTSLRYACIMQPCAHLAEQNSAKVGKKCTCSHLGNINGKGFIYEAKDMKGNIKVLIVGWSRRVTLQ